MRKSLFVVLSIAASGLLATAVTMSPAMPRADAQPIVINESFRFESIQEVSVSGQLAVTNFPSTVQIRGTTDEGSANLLVGYDANLSNQNQAANKLYGRAMELFRRPGRFVLGVTCTSDGSILTAGGITFCDVDGGDGISFSVER